MGWTFRNALIDPRNAHFCMLLCTSESPGISRNLLIWIHDRWRRWRQMLWNTWFWERGTLPGAMLGCRAAKQHPSNINSSWLHAAANIPDFILKGDGHGDGGNRCNYGMFVRLSLPSAFKNPGYEVDVSASMCELWMTSALKFIQAFYILSPLTVSHLVQKNVTKDTILRCLPRCFEARGCSENFRLVPGSVFACFEYEIVAA